LIDTHCHFEDPRFEMDRPACWERAQRRGVRNLLIPGGSVRNWKAVREVAGRFSLGFGVGTHPLALPDLGPEDPYLPEDLGGALAIGECGLDGRVPMGIQERVLELHLARSRDTGLPLILHAVRCHDRLLPILRRYAPLKGVLHSYSGGAQLVESYGRLGLHFSFGGAISWEGARKPVEALKAVPLDRLLVESDGPDQCPRPYRGRCEPSYLVEIVETMERIRGESLRERLCENAEALFGFTAAGAKRA
jgi:TatD DNase family protein